MGTAREDKGVTRAMAKGYARRRFFEAVSRAKDFARRAQAASHREPSPRPGRSFDVLLAKTLLRRRLITAEQLKECRDYIQMAEWLPDPVSLREAIASRGFVSKEALEATASELTATIAEMNRAYGEAAVRMGFVADKQMQECLAEVIPSQSKFALPRIFAQRGLISTEQHESVVRQLREELGHQAMDDHLEGDPEAR